MNHSTIKRIMLAGMLAALVVASVAPAAEAGHKRYKAKYKHHPKHHRVVKVQHARPSYHRVYSHHGDHGPAIAFIGGLVLGSVIGHASAAHDHYYYDPYCEVRFSSLDAYHGHFRHHHHPRVVRVVEVRTGHWVDTYRWNDDGWRHCDYRYGYSDYRGGHYDEDDWYDD